MARTTHAKKKGSTKSVRSPSKSSRKSKKITSESSSDESSEIETTARNFRPGKKELSVIELDGECTVTTAKNEILKNLVRLEQDTETNKYLRKYAEIRVS